jgi:ketosteroid isomerase-like protein
LKRFILSRSSRAAAGVVALLGTAATLSAHDFWLVPNAFVLAPGTALEVRGQTSSRFPTSESAVALNRIADARIIDATGETPLRDLSHSGNSLLIRELPQTAGQKVVAIVLRPASVRESPESFRRYLVLEGAPELAERYEREGKLPTDSITRRYAKYAKTIVEVGQNGARAFSRAAGHPLEFMPLEDPAALKAGDTFAVRLLYRGAPLSGAKVHASGVPLAPGLDPEAAAQQAVAVEGETDAQGVARFAVQSAGLWNVRTLHILPADPGSGADWDVHWATLVFGAGPAATSHAHAAGEATRVLGAPVRGGTEADSAAVVSVVDQYHRALAGGDTAAVLRLLAPDAIILESGGVETRSEYLSHHLPGDIAFAQAVARERGPIQVRMSGNTAWTTSTSTTVGEYRGRSINSQGAELMVLTRNGGEWKIRAIHWSSRNRRP